MEEEKPVETKRKAAKPKVSSAVDQSVPDQVSNNKADLVAGQSK